MSTPQTSPIANEDATRILGSDFLDQLKLAEELEIHQRTLARYEAAGIGPPRIKIGKRVLYNRQSVLEWIKSLEVAPPTRSGRAAKVRKTKADA